MTIKEAPTMGTHPDYYRDLLRRRFAGDPSLTPAELLASPSVTS